MNERQFRAWLTDRAPATVPASLRERIEGIAATPAPTAIGRASGSLLRHGTRRRALAVGLVAATLTGSLLAAGALVRQQDDARPLPRHNGLIAVATAQSTFIVADPVPGRPAPSAGVGWQLVQAGQHYAAMDLAFSPDGRSLATILTGSLAVLDLTTGDRETLLDTGVCDLGEPCGVTWSPDGTRIAFTTGPDLRVVDVSSHVTTTIATIPVRLTSVSWSPDGRTLAVVGDSGAPVFGATRELLTVRPDGGDLRHLVREEGDNFGPMDVEWSPDGTRIGFVASEAQGVPSPGVASAGPYRIEIVTVAPDGSDRRVLAQIGSCFCLGFWPPGFTWSPDGKQIAFVTTGFTADHVTGDRNDPSQRGLFVSALDGSDATLIQMDVMGSPAWQPVP